MGNNQSQSTYHANVDVVKKPPTRPSELPSAKLTSDLGPQGPTYNSPENLVLPRELPSRLNLRPVSAELSKYHPEFSEIFQHEANNNEEEEGSAEDGNINNVPKRPPQPVLNGHVTTGQNNQTVGQMPNGHVEQKQNNNNNNKNVNKPYRPSHRRQLSLTTNLTGQEHTIHEEPEESIDDRMKLDPLMQSFPGAIGPSLPVKNNFNLDYSYQCTYVQLAEHRRNKTIEDLEKKTGKKVSDLSNDLNDNIQEPFNRSDVTRQSSKSLGSAISLKKKRAPAPPSQAPPPPPGAGNTQSLPRSMPNTPRFNHSYDSQYSIDNEPPIDYDLVESPRQQNFMLPRYTAASPVTQGHKSRSHSMNTRPVSMPPQRSQSMSPTRPYAVAPPPPPPPAPPLPPQPSAQSVGAFAKRNPNVNVSRNNSMSAGKPELILKKTPSVKPTQKEESEGQVPWLLEIKSISEAKALRRQQSIDDNTVPPPPEFTDDVSGDNNAETNNDKNVSEKENKPKMVFQTSTEEFVPGKPKSDGSEANAPESPKLLRTTSATSLENQLAASNASPHLRRQTSFPATSAISDPSRRLSSLLQHDIKAAANAKCTRLEKKVTPTPPKPKDPHQVFREQLQKASAARDKRVEKTGSIDEQLQKLNSFEMETPEDARSVQSSASRDSREPPDTLPKPPRYHKNVTVNRNMSAVENGNARYNRQGRKGSNTQSMEWTPEDDLESDDNLSDREEMTLRRGAQEGFKSTIVPNNMTNLKKGSKHKNKPKKKAESFSVDEQNRNKFGSVKKLKKSVHKGVRNAFGSISKASGKILRRQKSEELETVADSPRNWSLTNGKSSKKSDRSYKYVVPDNYQLDDSDSDDGMHKYNENDHEFTEVVFRNAANHADDNDEDLTSDDDGGDDDSIDKSPAPVTRTGVAYLSAKGKLLLVQDEKSLKKIKAEEAKKMAAKSKQKKKKAKEEALENEIEKQRQLEEERRKQLEMELEYHKNKEKDTMERLQRLESAHMQQHINAQLYQQQQQQNVSMVSAPQLPPAGTFPPNYGTLPDRTQQQPFTNIYGHHQIPQTSYPNNFGLYHQSPGSFNLSGSMPGVSMDLNDYMRMLGLQNPPTSQQMAFFMNNMSFTGSQQPFERKSNPTLFNVINQTEPLKQFPASSMAYQSQGTHRQQGFQNWNSTPNINATIPMSTGVNIPLSDFVSSYNGANNNNSNSKNSDKDTNTSERSRNPVYDSDNSDEGLSPQRSIVTAQVRDFRPMTAGSESEKFMKKYGSSVSFPNKPASNDRMAHSSMDLTNNSNFLQRQRSVSPSASLSTVDSAITSMSATVSPPSSPSKSVDAPDSPMMAVRSETGSGFKTVLDLSSNTVQIDTISGQGAGH